MSEITEGLSVFREIGGWPEVLSAIFRGEDLDSVESSAALGEILDGRAEPSQIGAFLAALRTKGESIEEMIGLSRSMQSHAEHLIVPPGSIDTCGTGGDRSGTVNVSTMAAIVASGAGAIVCKHGGPASSSLAGSADVLSALGIAVDLGPAGVERCIAEAGIGFCFAPRFHPAMRYAGPVRRELGVATIFNFLGPLCNPASVTRQVIGVGDGVMAAKMIAVLEANGATKAMVVYGNDGLDELSVCARSTIHATELRPDGTYMRSMTEFDPREHGIGLVDPETLRGGDAEVNAGRARALFAGEVGPQRDFLLVNAAAALLVAGMVTTFGDGIALAAEVIDSGAAMNALHRFITVSQSAATEMSA